MKRNALSYLFLFFIGFALISLSSCQNKNKKTTAQPPVKHVVTIKLMKFNPPELKVNPGDTIEWINKGLVIHNVTDYPSKKWTSGQIKTGGSWKMVANESFDYFCSIHPTMKGKITVVHNK